MTYVRDTPHLESAFSRSIQNSILLEGQHVPEVAQFRDPPLGMRLGDLLRLATESIIKVVFCTSGVNQTFKSSETVESSTGVS